MRILYDGHIFRWQKTGGVSRYFSEVISRLPGDWEPTILGVAAANGNLPRHSQLEVSPLSSLRPRRFSQPAKRLWWKLRQIPGAGVLHPTHYTLTGGLRFSDFKCPIVVTAHDFIQARFSRLEDEAEATIRAQGEAIPRAAHVVCVSQATESDLLERFPQMSGRTSVIYHGSSFPVCSEPQPAAIFEAPTFLFVGRRGTYKNFTALLRAFARACQSNARIRLAVAGPSLSEEERWQIHFLGITDRIDSVVFPDEAALQRLYRQSVALVYPSRLEGFGMPPLEAMACGTLAVTSNTTSLPEVVGDAGIMLDPANEDQWTECMLAIAAQGINRNDLIERGKRRAATLTWDDSARRHIEIYRRLAQAN